MPQKWGTNMNRLICLIREHLKIAIQRVPTKLAWSWLSESNLSNSFSARTIAR